MLPIIVKHLYTLLNHSYSSKHFTSINTQE